MIDRLAMSNYGCGARWGRGCPNNGGGNHQCTKDDGEHSGSCRCSCGASQ